MLMYELLVGEAPFEDSPVMTKRWIVRGEYTVSGFISSEVKDLISRVSNSRLTACMWLKLITAVACA